MSPKQQEVSLNYLLGYLFLVASIYDSDVVETHQGTNWGKVKYRYRTEKGGKPYILYTDTSSHLFTGYFDIAGKAHVKIINNKSCLP